MQAGNSVVYMATYHDVAIGPDPCFAQLARLWLKDEDALTVHGLQGIKNTQSGRLET